MAKLSKKLYDRLKEDAAKEIIQEATAPKKDRSNKDRVFGQSHIDAIPDQTIKGRVQQRFDAYLDIVPRYNAILDEMMLTKFRLQRTLDAVFVATKSVSASELWNIESSNPKDRYIKYKDDPKSFRTKYANYQKKKSKTANVDDAFAFPDVWQDVPDDDQMDVLRRPGDDPGDDLQDVSETTETTSTDDLPNDYNDDTKAAILYHYRHKLLKMDERKAFYQDGHQFVADERKAMYGDLNRREQQNLYDVIDQEYKDEVTRPR